MVLKLISPVSFYFSVWLLEHLKYMCSLHCFPFGDCWSKSYSSSVSLCVCVYVCVKGPVIPVTVTDKRLPQDFSPSFLPSFFLAFSLPLSFSLSPPSSLSLHYFYNEPAK